MRNGGSGGVVNQNPGRMRRRNSRSFQHVFILWIPCALRELRSETSSTVDLSSRSVENISTTSSPRRVNPIHKWPTATRTMLILRWLQQRKRFATRSEERRVG